MEMELIEKYIENPYWIIATVVGLVIILFQLIDILNQIYMEKIKCPYCGYDGGPEYGTNAPFIDNLGVLKMDCARCTRRFNVKLKLSALPITRRQ